MSDKRACCSRGQSSLWKRERSSSSWCAARKSSLAIVHFLLFLLVSRELVSSAVASGAPLAGPQVLDLTSDNFDQTENGAPWVVGFFAPWCKHCKAFMPHYMKFAQELEGTPVHVGAIDGTADRDLAHNFNVTGFPAVFLIMPKEEVDKETGEVFTSGQVTVTQYYGLRIWQDLLVFVHFHTELPVTDGLSIYWRLGGAVFRWLITMFLIAKAIAGADSAISAPTILVFLSIVIFAVGLPAAILGLLSRLCERAYQRRKLRRSGTGGGHRRRRQDDEEEAVVKELSSKPTIPRRRGRRRERDGD